MTSPEAKTKFRRPREGDRPTEGKLDELLDDPAGHSSGGALAGYRDGSRVRRKIYLGLIGGTIVATVAGTLYMRHLEAQRETIVPQYILAEGAQDEDRPNAMEWTSGVARLGLARQTPGVRAILLPDKIITLAPGCDHAQIKVDVQDGQTVALKVLTGEIRQRPRPQAR